jgi:protein-tyrosine-phosphatase
MAMALFSDMVNKNHTHPEEWRIESAGCWAISGLPATGSANAAMHALGLSLDDHRSQPVTEWLLRDFKLVLCMEWDHKATLRRNYPAFAERCYLLSEMAETEQEIDDPVGLPIRSYQSTIQEITSYLNSGYQKICNLTD